MKPIWMLPMLGRYLFITFQHLWFAAAVLILAGGTAWSIDLHLPDRSFQGDMVVGQVTPGSALWVNGTPQTTGPQGHFILGVPRDLKRDLLVKARSKNETTSHTIRILKYDWRVQHVDGLAKNYVNPGKNERTRIEADRQKIGSVRRAQPYVLPFFLKKGFIMPVKGRISGIFGSQRVLNGEPRSPHSGLDIAAPLGTPAISPADGVIRLVVEDSFLMGNVLMIDHGLGVSSIFIHLDSVVVSEGDLVHQGDVVARVGQTGRATGPHLHWGVSVGSIPVDPMRLTGKKFIRPIR